MSFYDRIFSFSGNQFDYLHNYWESKRNQSLIGSVLVLSFLVSIAIIKMKRLDLLPDFASQYVTENIFFPIELAFSLLLIVEVVSLILTLSHSVAVSMGKQFEILALILLRKTFKDYSHLHKPITWDELYQGAIGEMALDSFGALLIFIGLLFIYKIQRHQAITRDSEEQERFILVKKQVALLLLLAFITLGLVYAYKAIAGKATFVFFEEFYTILIFSDILLVLVSLRYSYSFLVVFRNSGFAVATLVIRLGLSAPTPFNVLLGLAALAFVLGLSIAYNHFYQIQNEEHI